MSASPPPSQPASPGPSQRDQWVARVTDREIAPSWHDRFARLIVRELPMLRGGLVLDVHCGAGRLTSEILQRLDDGSRVFAFDPDPTALAMARARVRPEWRDRVYFKQGDVRIVTEMVPRSYDLVVANLVLGEAHDWRAVLSELVRVTKPGGMVLCTVAMRETWQEAEDLFGEVLRDAGMREAVARLERLRRLRPSPADLGRGLEALALPPEGYVVDHERFSLLFRSAREFLFSPVVEHGPLRLWKAVIGRDGNANELFWRLKETIDTYYGGHVFSVGVVAGLLSLEVPGVARSSRSLAQRWFDRYPNLRVVFAGEPALQGELVGEDGPRSVPRVREPDPAAAADPAAPAIPEAVDAASDASVEVDLDLEVDEARRTGGPGGLVAAAEDTPAFAGLSDEAIGSALSWLSADDPTRLEAGEPEPEVAEPEVAEPEVAEPEAPELEPPEIDTDALALLDEDVAPAPERRPPPPPAPRTGASTKDLTLGFDPADLMDPAPMRRFVAPRGDSRESAPRPPEVAAEPGGIAIRRRPPPLPRIRREGDGGKDP